MSSHAPTPSGPGTASTRLKVRWDNIMIVLIGLVAASFAVVAILMGSAGTTTPKPRQDQSTVPAEESTDAATTDDESTSSALTIDDAIGVVEEVRALMAEGRWDEAADRLELIPAELQDASGAATALEELTDLRGQHEQLRAQLEAAVEARNFTDARTILAKLAQLAPLDADLTATQQLVDTALTPKQPGTAPKDGATQGSSTPNSNSTATGGGGSSTATKPSTQKPASGGSKPSSGSSTKPASGGGAKPATGGARPSTTGGGAATGGAPAGGSSTGGSAGGSAGSAGGTSGINGMLGDIGTGINLTPEQEAELAAALEEAMAGL